MDEKDLYLIKRRNKKIRLVQIAKAIKCSPSLLSKYEVGTFEMSKDKIVKYREYIDAYHEKNTYLQNIFINL